MLRVNDIILLHLTKTLSVFGQSFKKKFSYFKSYIRDEESFIKTRCKELLDRYYERKGHEKRAIGVSKVSSMFSSDKKIEILISEELAASVLQGCF